MQRGLAEIDICTILVYLTISVGNIKNLFRDIERLWSLLYKEYDSVYVNI